MHHPTAFRYSALSLALFAAASQAQEATQLEAITIKSEGNANATAPVKDWRALERSTATTSRPRCKTSPALPLAAVTAPRNGRPSVASARATLTTTWTARSAPAKSSTTRAAS